MRILLIALAFLTTAATSIPAAAQGIALPVHGNWCGPNHGGGPALDLLDAACLRHDLCTIQAGRFDCGCDLAFMYELRHQPWPNAWLATKARGVFEAIAMTPCTGPGGQASKMSLAASDWMRDVTNGREAPWAFLDRLGVLATEGFSRAY